MSRTGMRSALRTSLAAGTAAAAFAVVLVAPGTAQAASYDDCQSGDVCFYTGANGSGQMCAWDGDDPDWRTGAVKCTWAATTNVRSVYNNGTKGVYQDVVYYSGKDYTNRIGCTKVGKKGNLTGTYRLRSHKWVTSC